MNGQLITDIFFDFCIFRQYFVADNLDSIYFPILEMLGLKNLAIWAFAK